jgi:hypothetical protein
MMGSARRMSGPFLLRALFPSNIKLSQLAVAEIGRARMSFLSFVRNRAFCLQGKQGIERSRLVEA